MARKNMEKTNNKRDFLEIIQRNRVFVEFVEERYGGSQSRMELLLDILWGMECKKKEELLRQIYLYGSMLKSRDLLARQIFLWLLEMAEAQE